MEGFQRGGGQTAGGVAAHGEVHVENELHLRVLRRVGNVGLQAADAGMNLGSAAGIQLELCVAGAVDDPVLRQIGFRHGAQIGRSEQFPPGDILQIEGGAGDDVEISQAYPLKIGGLVELDERRQRLIQHPGKFLPAGVGQRGQGDEVLGEIQLPSAVLREEVVVGDGRLRLWLTVDDLGRQNVLLPGVLGKILPDTLLKIGRLHIVDGENGGKAQLADDLVGQRFFIVGAGTGGKQHKNSSFA